MIETTSPVPPIQPDPKIAPAITHAAGIDIPEQARARLPHECAKCHARWGGLNTSHCSGCHITLTGLTAFDKHRSGSHSQGTRHCLSPEKVGLVDAGRAYPCWGLPGGETDWASVLDSDGAA